eukprot:363717-Chlamydomonas_euryale.AAC.12
MRSSMRGCSSTVSRLGHLGCLGRLYRPATEALHTAGRTTIWRSKALFPAERSVAGTPVLCMKL